MVPNGHAIPITDTPHSQKAFATAIVTRLLSTSDAWYKFYSWIDVLPGHELPCSVSLDRGVPHSDRAYLPTLGPTATRQAAKDLANENIIRAEKEAQVLKDKRVETELADEKLAAAAEKRAGIVEASRVAAQELTTGISVERNARLERGKVRNAQKEAKAQEILLKAATRKQEALEIDDAEDAVTTAQENLQALKDRIQPDTTADLQALELETSEANARIKRAASEATRKIEELRNSVIQLDKEDTTQMQLDATPATHVLPTFPVLTQTVPNKDIMDVDVMDLDMPTIELFNLSSVRSAGLDSEVLIHLIDAFRNLPREYHADLMLSTDLTDVLKKESQLAGTLELLSDANAPNVSPLRRSSKRQRELVPELAARKRKVLETPSGTPTAPPSSPSAPNSPGGRDSSLLSVKGSQRDRTAMGTSKQGPGGSVANAYQKIFETQKKAHAQGSRVSKRLQGKQRDEGQDSDEDAEGEEEGDE